MWALEHIGMSGDSMTRKVFDRGQDSGSVKATAERNLMFSGGEEHPSSLHASLSHNDRSIPFSGLPRVFPAVLSSLALTLSFVAFLRSPFTLPRLLSSPSVSSSLLYPALPLPIRSSLFLFSVTPSLSLLYPSFPPLFLSLLPATISSPIPFPKFSPLPPFSFFSSDFPHPLLFSSLLTSHPSFPSLLFSILYCIRITGLFLLSYFLIFSFNFSFLLSSVILYF